MQNKIWTLMAAAGLGLLSACASLQGGSGLNLTMPGTVPANPAVAATWYNPPAEFPGICITQFKDGSLRFDGGFAFLNPGRWSYDAATAELRFELKPWPQLAKAHANTGLHQQLLRVEADKNALVYRVKAETKSIGLGGFIFYRDMACPGKSGKAAS
ncbi:hypothetical protein [Janthinobacterium aquaticum]|uniref:hypothetical protein n=1 Tax=Janthinobacterium sp. FT58W TaxID=2654254 RepID=UPI001265675D|nr:hypothetical protein [Janthinobacterium sp. FT58W]KAB8045334.1 hypothetical protein GCM43_02695 [Janthinobacterium sp. FT58W]